MKSVPGCEHARYFVEPNGRVVVQTLSPGGSVNDSRRFRNMKAAHKVITKDIYCGKRGAAFLASGKNRSHDLFWAVNRLDGIDRRVARGRVAPRKKAPKRKVTRSCGCGG
jgi:hypothetical protein